MERAGVGNRMVRICVSARKAFRLARFSWALGETHARCVLPAVVGKLSLSDQPRQRIRRVTGPASGLGEGYQRFGGLKLCEVREKFIA